MRILLLVLGICVGLVGIGNRAQAQNYPWCAIYSGGSSWRRHKLWVCDVPTMHGDSTRARQLVPAKYTIRNSTRAASVEQGL
jgi:hypothetical protein